jgi:hypothetical protein
VYRKVDFHIKSESQMRSDIKTPTPPVDLLKFNFSSQNHSTSPFTLISNMPHSTRDVTEEVNGGQDIEVPHDEVGGE